MLPIHFCIIMVALVISSRILWTSGKKVMIDRDLAELYGVTTKRLDEQVKRNSSRFRSSLWLNLKQPAIWVMWE